MTAENEKHNPPRWEVHKNEPALVNGKTGHTPSHWRRASLMPPKQKQGTVETPFEAGGFQWLLRVTSKVRSIRCDSAPGGRIDKTLRKADNHIAVANLIVKDLTRAGRAPASRSIYRRCALTV